MIWVMLNDVKLNSSKTFLTDDHASARLWWCVVWPSNRLAFYSGLRMLQLRLPILSGDRRASRSLDTSPLALMKLVGVTFAAITRQVSGAFIRSRAQRRQGPTTTSFNKSRNPVGQYNILCVTYFAMSLDLLYSAFENICSSYTSFSNTHLFGYTVTDILIWLCLSLTVGFTSRTRSNVVLVCREATRDLVNKRRHLWFAADRSRGAL